MGEIGPELLPEDWEMTIRQMHIKETDPVKIREKMSEMMCKNLDWLQQNINSSKKRGDNLNSFIGRIIRKTPILFKNMKFEKKRRLHLQNNYKSNYLFEYYLSLIDFYRAYKIVMQHWNIDYLKA